MTLAEEQRRLQLLLKGRTVKRIWRHRKKELGIEFTDGTRLYIDWHENRSLEFSVA